MHFLTSLPTNDMEAIRNTFYPEFDLTQKTLPQNYSVTAPFKLEFITLHPDDEDHYFIDTHVEQKGSIYVLMEKEAVYAHLEKSRLHKHDFYEFMFVLDGEIYVNIENQRHVYAKGNCCILNRNVMHTEEYSTDFKIVFLQLGADFMTSIYNDLCLDFFDVEKTSYRTQLMDFFKMNLTGSVDFEKDYVDLIPNADNDYLVKHVHDIFDKITRESMSPKIGSSIEIKHLIASLFSFLSVPQNFSTTPIRIGSDAEYLTYTHIVEAMIETNGRISRSQLAEKLNYSGAYLNEISKKYSGLSLFDLGMTYCMKEAARLLTETTENINDIILALGFSNKTHFNKIFKETYQLTPSEYRRRS